MRTWSKWLVSVAAVLLLPSACATITGSLATDDDWSVAFTPIARMSLESLRPATPVEVIFRVPDSAQWTRIRQERTMGDNGYVVLAADKRGGWLIPFSTLDLDVIVSGSGGPISTKNADYSPYGYSSHGPDVGPRFKSASRDEIRVRIRARHPELLPTGELIIEPYWSWTAKDFGVGASFVKDLRPIVIRITQLALGLFTLGVFIEPVARVRERHAKGLGPKSLRDSR